MSDSGRLFGVRALVCGGANGIGEAVARTLARHDARVLAADNPETDIAVRYRDVPGVTGMPLGLGGADGALTATRTAADELDGLDVVIVCMNLQPQKPQNDAAVYTEASKQRLAQLNQFFDAAQPLLQKSPGGRFIVLGQLRSAFAKDAEELFARSEQELAELVRAQAVRSGQYGITVNYVQPGALMTPESRKVFSDDKALRDYCIARSAARRLGEPLDVAKAVLFLASDDATFVSGSGVAVDGGRSQ
jgi:NAD(P)-dependent dehydrogenase (short-subunit alcohol dehydrogenase family)